jgi:hypothetical protein
MKTVADGAFVVWSGSQKAIPQSSLWMRFIVHFTEFIA